MKVSLDLCKTYICSFMFLQFILCISYKFNRGKLDWVGQESSDLDDRHYQCYKINVFSTTDSHTLNKRIL